MEFDALTGGAGDGARERLTEEYVAVLSDRLTGNEEAALQRAYDLGRQALDDGLGALEIALMHQEALLTVLREHPLETLQVGQAATAVLLEVLAPIEMARRGFEARLLEAERLAGIGSVLSAAAHELGSPLAVISGNVALLREGAAEPAAAQVEGIAEAGERCARIVDSLLELARRHPPGRQMVSLNEIVQGALPLLSYRFRIHEVEVALELSPDLPRLWADPHQLRQVVVSLSANADQAMRHTPPPRRLRVATRPLPPRGVLLEVADNGPGLPPDQQGRSLERVVAAKGVGEGTGLGLPVCRRIVEWHGGALLADSPPGQGAIFRIELPVGTMPMESSARAAVQGRRILVLHDDPLVATVLAEILALDGHHVDVAPHGIAALTKLREHPYASVVSDVRMPGFDGPGLYRELLRRDPELARRFIFIVGDVPDPHVAAFVKETGARCLRKPFLPDEVRRVICEA